MGAVEVLRPRDPLQSRLNYRDTRFANSGAKSKRDFSSNPNPKPSRGLGKSDRRKRSPQKNGNSSAGRCGSGSGSGGVNLISSPPERKGSLVMGRVKILKRGEALSDTTSSEELKKVGEKLASDLVLSTPGRPGSELLQKEPGWSNTGRPGLEKIQRGFKITDFYAGSACVSSPPPSSLPVPAFFKKKNVLVDNNDDAIAATCELGSNC